MPVGMVALIHALKHLLRGRVFCGANIEVKKNKQNNRYGVHLFGDYFLCHYVIDPIGEIKEINKINKNIKGNLLKKIMFSITTCKRFDLFEKTINSFLNCCNDIDTIDYWLCVDDNSSIEDRNYILEKLDIKYDFRWN